MHDACADLLQRDGRIQSDPDLFAAGVDSLTDGLRLRVYLTPETSTPALALEITARHLAAYFPEHAETFLSRLVPERCAATWSLRAWISAWRRRSVTKTH
jgi:hypothetical protein